MWFLLMSLPVLVEANKPVFDVSNSMRLLMLPADARPGSVVYKLRASDADDDYPLTFRAFGRHKTPYSSVSKARFLKAKTETW